MTEYSFSQQIIWPVLAAVDEAKMLELARDIEKRIFAEFFQPIDVIEAETRCNCTGVLHRLDCPAAGWVT